MYSVSLSLNIRLLGVAIAVVIFIHIPITRFYICTTVHCMNMAYMYQQKPDVPSSHSQRVSAMYNTGTLFILHTQVYKYCIYYCDGLRSSDQRQSGGGMRPSIPMDPPLSMSILVVCVCTCTSRATTRNCVEIDRIFIYETPASLEVNLVTYR
jgi:hypothetical protein